MVDLSKGSKLRKVFAQIARMNRVQYPDYLAERAKLAQRVRDAAEDGMVVLVRNGTDCDGVRYSGVTRPVKAVPYLVHREIEKDYEYADGPMSIGVVSPSAAREIEYESRDMVMEAFEDGHPHVLYG